jgi:hypothetical protein
MVVDAVAEPAPAALRFVYGRGIAGTTGLDPCRLAAGLRAFAAPFVGAIVVRDIRIVVVDFSDPEQMFGGNAGGRWLCSEVE